MGMKGYLFLENYKYSVFSFIVIEPYIDKLCLDFRS